MDEEPRYDFPAVSGGDGQDAGPSLAEARFGDVVLREEPLYEDIGGDWANGEWGPRIGSVTIEHRPTSDPKRILARATFIFDDGDTVEFVGLVPGAGSWKGRGRFGYRGGTGKFQFPRAQLPVESTNPRRWG